MINNITKEQKKKAGIYEIRNLVNGKIYVGQTINFQTRYITHLNDFRRNEHCNIILSEDYKLFGEANFKFTPIYVTDLLSNKKELMIQLHKVECDFIKRYNSSSIKYGYNIHPPIVSCVGWKMKPESIEKIRAKALARAKNGPIAPILKGEDNPSAVITNDLAREIKILISRGWSNHNIALKLKVNATRPCEIRNGRTWAEIEVSINEMESYSGELFFKGGNIDEVKVKIGLFLFEKGVVNSAIATYLGCKIQSVRHINKTATIKNYSLLQVDRDYYERVLPIAELKTIVNFPGRYGDKHPEYKNKLDMVVAVKVLIAKGWNNMQIADYLNTKPYIPTVIRNNRAWSHVIVTQSQIDAFQIDS